MSNEQMFAKALNLKDKFSDIVFGVDDVVAIQERSWNCNDGFGGRPESFSVQTNIHLSSGISVATEDFCDSVLDALEQHGRQKPVRLVHEIRLLNSEDFHTHRSISYFAKP